MARIKNYLQTEIPIVFVTLNVISRSLKLKIRSKKNV